MKNQQKMLKIKKKKINKVSAIIKKRVDVIVYSLIIFT